MGYKWVNGSEYERDGEDGVWIATGNHAQGVTNTPRAGEPEGSRDRKPKGGWTVVMDEHIHDACIPPDALPRLETNSAKRKEYPIYSGPLRYFPDALAEIAQLCKVGNDKHNPGEPLHWSRGKSDDHLDCLARHLVEAGTLDDDGLLHDVKIAWRALANLQVTLERVRKLPISPGSKP